MKKLLTILSLFIFTSVFSQDKSLRFKAISTQLYYKNQTTDEWELYQKNGTTDIDIVLEKNILTVYAESPAMYKLDSKSFFEIDVKSFNGLSYLATELKKDINCRVDLLKHKESRFWILSVFYPDVNLRYTLEEN